MNPTVVTVYDTVSGTTKQINESDIVVGQHFKTDGSIGISTTQNGTQYDVVLTLNNTTVSLADNSTNGGSGGTKVYDFPEGLFDWQGAVTDLHLTGDTGLSTTSAVVGALGTVVADNSNATLTSTEADLAPSTTATMTARESDLRAVTSTALKALFDGTATAKDMYLNLATVDAGISGAAVVTVRGTIKFSFDLIGDK